jgi:hypothetical protein
MAARDDRIAVRVTHDLHIRVKEICHRAYPDVRARAPSSRAAAAQLLLKLAHFRDTAGTDGERASIDRAIDDVERFARRCRRSPIPNRSH